MLARKGCRVLCSSCCIIAFGSTLCACQVECRFAHRSPNRFEAQLSPRARAKAKLDLESSQGSMERHPHHLGAITRSSASLHHIMLLCPLHDLICRRITRYPSDGNANHACCWDLQACWHCLMFAVLGCSAGAFDADAEPLRPVTSASRPQSQVPDMPPSLFLIACCQTLQSRSMLPNQYH